MEQRLRRLASWLLVAVLVLPLISGCGKVDTKGLPEGVFASLQESVEATGKHYTQEGRQSPGKLREIVHFEHVSNVYFVLARLQNGSLLVVIEPDGARYKFQVPISMVGVPTRPQAAVIPASMVGNRVVEAAGKQWIVAYGNVWEGKVVQVALVTEPPTSVRGVASLKGFLVVGEVASNVAVKGIKCFDKDGREIEAQTVAPR